MKVSQLKDMVARMVREELERQLPQIVTEMFVRTVVREMAEVAAPAPRPVRPRRRPAAPAPRGSLREALDIDEAIGAEFYAGMDRDEERPVETRTAHLMAARSTVQNLSPALAELAADTLSSIERGEHLEEEAIPLREASSQLPGLDFSRMKKMALLMEDDARSKAPDPEIEARRVEMIRKRADSIKVG